MTGGYGGLEHGSRREVGAGRAADDGRILSEMWVRRVTRRHDVKESQILNDSW